MHHRIGKLYVVATPIGNLGDLTERAKQVLSQVTWVAAEDTRHSSGLLAHIGASAKLISYHDHNEEARLNQLIAWLQEGQDGALISDAGTPLISDPGYGLVYRAHQAGIPVIPIPGPCSPIVALSACGLPTDAFLFVGFLPAKSLARSKRLETLKLFEHTMIFLEAPHRILACVEDALAVFGGERRACIARELTKRYESVILLPLKELYEKLLNESIPQKGEFVFIVEGNHHADKSDDQTELARVLAILLPQMPLKQAVSITVALTGQPKNHVYDFAMELKKSYPGA